MSERQIPTPDRALDLIDLASADNGVKVLGWADNGVMLEPPQCSPWSTLNFTVDDHPTSPCGHEDMVLVVAVRVPHPDEMSLDEIVGPPTPGSTGSSRSSGETATSGGWWYLSFADPELPTGTQFLGACYIPGDNMIDAITNSHRLGLNPGGEVVAIPVPPGFADKVPPAYRQRLLTRQEVDDCDTEIEHG